MFAPFKFCINFTVEVFLKFCPLVFRVLSTSVVHPVPGIRLILKLVSLVPSVLYLNNPPIALLAFCPIKILSCESSATPVDCPSPSVPIQLPILAELSTKNKIFAGTSPSPAPGGTGFALTLLLKTNVIKNINIFSVFNIIYSMKSITCSPIVLFNIFAFVIFKISAISPLCSILV